MNIQEVEKAIKNEKKLKEKYEKPLSEGKNVPQVTAAIHTTIVTEKESLTNKIEPNTTVPDSKRAFVKV